MSTDNKIELVISADASGFRRGAQEARDHVSSLLGDLKSFKSEAVSTGREARFFANELGSIIPGADGAKDAVRDLIAVGLAGGGIGAMVESVKLLATVFKEVTAEEDKAKEDFKKFIDDQTKSVDALKTSVEKMLLVMQGATRAQVLDFEQTHDLLEQKKVKTKALADATEYLAAVQKIADDATSDAAGADIALLAAQKRVAGIQDELKAIDDLIAKKKQAIDPLATADAAQKEADDQAKLRLAEGKMWSDYYQKKYDEAQKAYTDQEKAQVDHLTRLHKAEAEAEIAIQKMKDDQLKYQLQREKLQEKAADEQAADLKAKFADVMKVAKPFEHAFQSAFKAVIDGTKSISQALEQLGKDILIGIVDQLIKMATEAIATAIATALVVKTTNTSKTMGNIAVAESGAAAAMASIPFAGPELAVAAAEAMKGFLISETTPLLSAAGGFDIPSGINPVVQTHAREMILPAELADAVRGMAGGGGGGGVTINVNAIDGQSVKNFVSGAEFRRAVREAIRNNRWDG